MVIGWIAIRDRKILRPLKLAEAKTSEILIAILNIVFKTLISNYMTGRNSELLKAYRNTAL